MCSRFPTSCFVHAMKSMISTILSVEDGIVSSSYHAHYGFTVIGMRTGGNDHIEFVVMKSGRNSSEPNSQQH